MQVFYRDDDDKMFNAHLNNKRRQRTQFNFNRSSNLGFGQTYGVPKEFEKKGFPFQDYTVVTPWKESLSRTDISIDMHNMTQIEMKINDHPVCLVFPYNNVQWVADDPHLVVIFEVHLRADKKTNLKNMPSLNLRLKAAYTNTNLDFSGYHTLDQCRITVEAMDGARISSPAVSTCELFTPLFPGWAKKGDGLRIDTNFVAKIFNQLLLEDNIKMVEEAVGHRKEPLTPDLLARTCFALTEKTLDFIDKSSPEAYFKRILLNRTLRTAENAELWHISEQFWGRRVVYCRSCNGAINYTQVSFHKAGVLDEPISPTMETCYQCERLSREAEEHLTRKRINKLEIEAEDEDQNQAKLSRMVTHDIAHEIFHPGSHASEFHESRVMLKKACDTMITSLVKTSEKIESTFQTPQYENYKKMLPTEGQTLCKDNAFHILPALAHSAIRMRDMADEFSYQVTSIPDKPNFHFKQPFSDRSTVILVDKATLENDKNDDDDGDKKAKENGEKGEEDEDEEDEEEEQDLYCREMTPMPVTMDGKL